MAPAKEVLKSFQFVADAFFFFFFLIFYLIIGDCTRERLGRGGG